MSELDRTLPDYASALASKAAVPGGGGAAAYVGALGAALGSMVGNLTTGKKTYADVEDEITELIARADALRDQLLELSDADAAVFLPLSEAYGLPSTTLEEQAHKQAVLQPALRAAAEVPLQMCEVLVEVIGVLGRFAEIGSRLAVSDAGCGAALCRAALQSAELNVLVNTRLLDDDALRRDLDARTSELVARGVRQADTAMAAVANHLRRS